MKNLILVIAFMLIGGITFASENSVNTNKESVKIEQSTVVDIEQKQNLEQLNAILDCIHVTLSCGVQYDICNFQGTTQQLINTVLNNNNNVCGTEIQMIN